VILITGRPALTGAHTAWALPGLGEEVADGEFAVALEAAMPGAQVNPLPGRAGSTANPYLDITRPRAGTGSLPAFDITTGAAGYVTWPAGNPR
jgi:nucleoside-diphosphate-sugar epimerase